MYYQQTKVHQKLTPTTPCLIRPQHPIQQPHISSLPPIATKHTLSWNGTSIGEQTDINRRNNGELTEKYRGKSASHQTTRVRLASKYFNNKKYIFYIRHIISLFSFFPRCNKYFSTRKIKKLCFSTPHFAIRDFLITFAVCMNKCQQP